MVFDAGQQNFKDLVQLLRNGERLFVFFGAGTSIYGPPGERLPAWGQMVGLLIRHGREEGLLSEEEAVRAEDLLKNQSAMTALNLVMDGGRERRMRAAVFRMLNTKDRPIPPVLAAMTQLPIRGFITTNLDVFFEEAWAKHRRSRLELFTHKDARNVLHHLYRHEQQPFLYKIHGTLADPSSWILSDQQYRIVTKSPSYYQQSLGDILKHHLLFVGYGLSDPDFDLVLDRIDRVLPEGGGCRFVLADEASRRDASFLKKRQTYDFSPIWFKKDPFTANDPGGGYEDVSFCIDRLSKELSVGEPGQDPVPTGSISVDLSHFPTSDKLFVGREHEARVLSGWFLDKGERIVQVIGLGGEGKTSFVMNWLEQNRLRCAQAGMVHVIGCSLYKADMGRLIEHAYSILEPRGEALTHKQRIEGLREAMKHKPFLWVLDGLEVFQNKEGGIENEQLRDLVNDAAKSQCRLLITSRLEVKGLGRLLPLRPLERARAVELLERHNLGANLRDLDWVADRIGGHALSLRVLAGWLKENGFGVNRLRGLPSLTQIPNESDPLTANKAEAIFETIKVSLPNPWRSLVQVVSLVRRPVSQQLLGRLLAAPPLGFYSQEKSGGISLGDSLEKLQGQGLLIQDRDGDWTCHPLVRTFFRESYPKDERRALHRYFLACFSRVAVKQPRTLQECFGVFECCYHAARGEAWDQFHDWFFRKLNRGHLKYLAYILGAWEESLDLALLTFTQPSPSSRPMIRAAYYHGVAASCLKRLGRTAQAVLQYEQSITCHLRESDDTAYPMEAAMQLNCLAALCLAMGELELALRLLPLNFAALHWITDDEERCWQQEHALITAGRLAGRLYRLDRSREYFQAAETMRGLPNYNWRRHHSLERNWCIVTHLADGDYQRAERECQAVCGVAQEQDFGDVGVSAMMMHAMVWRLNAREQISSERRRSCLERAVVWSKKSTRAASDRVNDELEIQVLLERCCLAWDCQAERSLAGAPPEEETARLEQLVNRSGLLLYRPELNALRARDSLFRDHRARAEVYLQKAVAEAADRGDLTALRFKGSLIGELSQRMGLKIPKTRNLGDLIHPGKAVSRRMEKPEVAAFFGDIQKTGLAYLHP